MVHIPIEHVNGNSPLSMGAVQIRLENSEQWPTVDTRFTAPEISPATMTDQATRLRDMLARMAKESGPVPDDVRRRVSAFNWPE